MFLIDVENAAGERQGPGPITSALEFSRRVGLDEIGEASFRVPADDPDTALIGAGYYHVYRWDPIKQTRQDLGVWKHRAARIRQDGDAAMLEVECYGLEVELVHESVYFNRGWSDTATNTVVAALVALAGGWSGGTIANPGNVTVGFQGESVFRALVAVAERWGYHFRQGATARTLDFGAFGDDCGIRLIAPRSASPALESNDAVALITGIEVVEETDRIVNKLVPLGAGLGETQLNVSDATVTDPGYPVQTGTNGDGSSYYYISDAASIAAYGLASVPFVKSDIRPLSNSDADVENAKNALYRTAVSFLEAHLAPLTVYAVTCTKLRGAWEVGDRIRLVYRGVVTRDGEPYRYVDVDALQYIIAIDEQYGQDGGEEYRLELSASGYRVGSDGDILAGIQHDVNVWKTHLQTYPCRSLDTRYEEMDSTHEVDVPVDIDDAVLYLNSALLRIKTRPLRATAKGASDGGGATSSASSESTTVGDGGFEESSEASSAATTASGGSVSTSTTGSAHRHVLAVMSAGTIAGRAYVGDIPASTSGTGDLDKVAQVELEADEDGVAPWARIGTYNDSPAHTHGFKVPAHTHGMAHTHMVEVGDHTHGMQHTHTVPNHVHNLDYGIHDDTEYPDTVRMAIDGVDRTAALGGPWGAGGAAVNEELDITTYLVNAAGGLRSEHTVTISCDAAQGTVETVVKLQMTVQGIAVS